MRSSGAFSTFLLVAAAAWLVVGLFMPSKQADQVDFDLYALLANAETAAPADAGSSDKADGTKDRDSTAPKSLDDQVWSILLPKRSEERFSGTGGAVPIRLVASGDEDIAVSREELDAAVEGALDGTPEGNQALMHFFDVVGGNDSAIAYRAQLLLEAIAGDSSVAGSLPALTEAATNISEAAFASLWSSYLMRANFQPDFTLSPGSIGYDFGPVASQAGVANPVYQGFVRIPADSGHVEGDASDVETSSTRLWGDGVRDMNVFTADVPNGTYRVFVLTSEEGGVGPDDAFGTANYLRSEDPLRRVDLLHADENVAQALMNRQGVGATMNLSPSLAADGAGGKGSVLVFRTEVRDGVLYIDFPPGMESTYIVGIVVVPVEDLLGAQLSEMISDLLETIHPAAGPSTGQATNFASTTQPAPDAGSGGSGTGGGPGVPFTEVTPTGDGDGDTGGDSTGGDSTGGDGTGGDGTGGDGDASIALQAIVAESPIQVQLGDLVTLDGTPSLLNGGLIDPNNIPADLTVEWLFDIDGDGVLDVVATDLVAVIDSDIFGATGEFQGILRLTLDGVECNDTTVICEDDIVIIITAGGGGAVPEPGAAGLLAGGAIMVAVLRRRRRRRLLESA